MRRLSFEMQAAEHDDRDLGRGGLPPSGGASRLHSSNAQLRLTRLQNAVEAGANLGALIDRLNAAQAEIVPLDAQIATANTAGRQLLADAIPTRFVASWIS
jgi:hypothetical protein